VNHSGSANCFSISEEERGVSEGGKDVSKRAMGLGLEKEKTSPNFKSPPTKKEDFNLGSKDVRGKA